MFKPKCPYCNSPIVKKNGVRNSVQLYKCMACGRQFRNRKKVSKEELWESHLLDKKTIKRMSSDYGLSRMTIIRRLNEVELKWEDPPLSNRHGVIHLDVTYFGRNDGVLIALEESSNLVLYMKFTQHEHVQDYVEAVDKITSSGYKIDGIVIDGLQSLFDVFSPYNIQMCQFHMVAIIRRKLTMHPKTLPSIELKEIAKKLKICNRCEFEDLLNGWNAKWTDYLKETSFCVETGKWRYKHRKLRSASFSLKRYLPFLFTFEHVEGMPNTNNKIEGVFTHLKKQLNNHSGLSKEHRERFVIGFFLAWNEVLHD